MIFKQKLLKRLYIQSGPPSPSLCLMNAGFFNLALHMKIGISL